MPLTPDQHDEMRWDDDGAGSAISSTPESGKHGVWCACVPSECPVNMRSKATVDALADDIVAETVSWAGRVGGPFSVALDRAEAWLTIMDMSNSNAGKDE